ncbi:hypothetical protein [Pseudobacteroides cellulosolvens]|uniref:Uncharacterized protein n=1 Tax=Pseudobacteroides cellulosolvens ATCC 35603 = DSM 2933 TaxID=398512 RepID=A0A0L6JVJ6_9FIRM|nr:hypothetical protein [Pseudobacteroides cellulosolvens]KNY29457.1 hypothetical protein Bccel_4731 [Pseudobacteroides cellulosolvens ATCC 35603 = DSM 2933]
MNKILIVYYSLFQNTANLVLEIAIQTDGSGGFCQIQNDIARECPKSIILPGIAVNGVVSSEEVTNWLETIGYKL